MTDQSTISAVEQLHATQAISRGRKTLAKLQGRIHLAVLEKNGSRIRGLMSVMLTSYGCKLAALEYANRGQKPYRRTAIERLPGMASKLDLWTPSNEPVRVRSEIKRSGGFRIIMSFGLENRAKQTLVRWALQSWIHARLLPRQHVLKGGRSAAVGATSAMIEEGGHKHAIELDIKDCFGSIDVGWLRETLPIPPAVTDAVCAVEQLTLEHMDTRALSHLHRSRNGIPQGSVVSPLLAEFAVACALATVPSGVNYQAYVDNVFCSARSEEELRQHYLTLQRCFAAHPSGFFAVRPSRMQELKSGFSVLGYQVERRRRKVVVRVGANRQEAFLSRVEALWDRYDLGTSQRLNMARQLIRGWCASHSLWWGVGTMERQIRSHIRWLVPCTYNPIAALAARPTY